MYQKSIDESVVIEMSGVLGEENPGVFAVDQHGLPKEVATAARGLGYKTLDRVDYQIIVKKPEKNE